MQLSIDNVASVFQSLTDVTRLRILRLFLCASDDLCLCDVSAALNEPTYKVSRHLKALREAGLLDSRRSGRWLYHRVAADAGIAQNLFRLVEALEDSKGQLRRDERQLKTIREKRNRAQCEGVSQIPMEGRV